VDGVRYEERLWAPAWMWVVAALLTLTVGVAYGVPLGLQWGALAFVIVGVGLAWLLIGSATRIRVSSAGLAAGRSHEGDHELVRRDGSRFWCHIKATPIDAAAPAKGAIWVFVDVQERVEADRRIRHLAHHDPLTGLPNRILLRDRLGVALAQARRQALLTCLLLVDLDRFKAINDQHGHDAGDAVLVEVGRRIALCVREGDTVARLGGDEFVVVLSGLRARDHCAVIAQKLIDALAAPIAHGGLTLSVGASIGIAVFPDNATDADRLMKCADAAMYRIKVRGGNGFCYFTTDEPVG